jgi:hypothetical protein
MATLAIYLPSSLTSTNYSMITPAWLKEKSCCHPTKATFIPGARCGRGGAS